MFEIFAAIQILTLSLIFLIFYQVRKQYLIELHKFRAQNTSEFSGQYSFESTKSDVNSAQTINTEISTHTASVSFTEDSELGMYDSQNRHQDILDDYIGDFFSSGPNVEKKSVESKPSVFEKSSRDTMNDEFITVAHNI